MGQFDRRRRCRNDPISNASNRRYALAHSKKNSSVLQIEALFELENCAASHSHQSNNRQLLLQYFDFQGIGFFPRCQDP